jgi:hypothetical protein
MPRSQALPEELSGDAILEALDRVERPASRVCHQRRPGGNNSRPYLQLEMLVDGRTRRVRVYLKTGTCRLPLEGGPDIARIDPRLIRDVLHRHHCYLR